MRNINIHTTLGIEPPFKKHSILVITRGASAVVNFNLQDKVYTMDDIDQMTFIFKQGKKLHWFNLVDYFTLTSDTLAQADKIYYNRIPSNIGSQSSYKFTPAEISMGAIIKPEDNLYETCELADGVYTENWQFDDHFTYEKGETFGYVSLMLRSKDTLEFSPTVPDNNMQFEVAVRLNTDHLQGMHSHDSVIICPQHPIAVVDSLYSKLGNSSEGSIPIPVSHAVASEDTYCADTLYCND